MAEEELQGREGLGLLGLEGWGEEVGVGGGWVGGARPGGGGVSGDGWESGERVCGCIRPSPLPPSTTATTTTTIIII